MRYLNKQKHAGSNSQKSRYHSTQILGDTYPLFSKRKKISFLSPTQKLSNPSSLSLSSTYTELSLSSSHPQGSCSPSRHPSKMTIIITSALRKWLTDHDLQGFIQVAEATPHPNALEMASKLNIDILTNSMVHRGTPV